MNHTQSDSQTGSVAVEAVQLPAPLYAAIVEHARWGKPEEICGIVRGRGLTALEIVPGENIADDKVNNYTVDPRTLLRQFDFEDDGDEMMGIYHSHPISVAYPSATDAWNAHYPDPQYLICSLEKDDAPVVRSFRLVQHFLDLNWQELLEALPFDEVRDGLYGYFLDASDPTPPCLAGLVQELAAPLYIVFRADDDADNIDGRVVTVREHPVAVSS